MITHVPPRQPQIPDWDAWPGLLAQTDGMGRVLAANAELRALAGWDQPLPEGLNLDVLLPPASRILMQTHVWPLLLAQREVRELHVLLRPPGRSSLPALVEARSVVDADGQVTVHWLFMVTHERSRFEAALVDARAKVLDQAHALREANDRYDRILETSHDGVVTLNADGAVDYANSRTLDILGASDGPVGLHFSELLSHPELGLELLATSQSPGAVLHKELDLIHVSGRRVSCELALMHLQPRPGKASGWLVMFSDISERKALERSLLELNASLEATVAVRTAELLNAKEAAEAANRDKSIFLTNISHELRSPLHGILGFSRLLIDDPELDAERREVYLRKVERNGSNLLSLVNDLLDSAKIETQGFTITSQPCDLAEIARNVASEFRVGTEPVEPVRLDVPETASCVGDSQRLAQVIRNLVANAIRFSPKGSPVDVLIASEGAGLMVAVQDRGPGIPEGELELIFQRFSQSSKTRTGAGGTGLGLPIARGIVEQHGGWIKAENRAGGGAVFRLFIPVVLAL